MPVVYFGIAYGKPVYRTVQILAMILRMEEEP